MYQVKIKKLEGYEDMPIPHKMSEGASGFDLFAGVQESVILRPSERRLIPTGLTLELPLELEAQVRPRSGLALKHGITLVNTPGTIDADYRGEIGVIMINHGTEPFTIERGQRIAQLVFIEVPKVKLVEVTEVAETKRGSGGFGHTGV